MTKSFYELLTEQIGHEFAASHQYLAMAIWLDGWPVTSTDSRWRNATTP